MREEDQIIDEVNHLLDKLKDLEARMQALQDLQKKQDALMEEIKANWPIGFTCQVCGGADC